MTPRPRLGPTVIPAPPLLLFLLFALLLFVEEGQLAPEDKTEAPTEAAAADDDDVDLNEACWPNDEAVPFEVATEEERGAVVRGGSVGAGAP